MFERHLRFEVTANGTSLIDEMTLLQGILGYLNVWLSDTLAEL